MASGMVSDKNDFELGCGEIAILDEASVASNEPYGSEEAGPDDCIECE